MTTRVHGQLLNLIRFRNRLRTSHNLTLRRPAPVFIDVPKTGGTWVEDTLHEEECLDVAKVSVNAGMDVGYKVAQAECSKWTKHVCIGMKAKTTAVSDLERNLLNEEIPATKTIFFAIFLHGTGTNLPSRCADGASSDPPPTAKTRTPPAVRHSTSAPTQHEADGQRSS